VLLGAGFLLQAPCCRETVTPSFSQSRKAGSSVDENQLVSLFDRSLDPSLDSASELAMFGEVQEKVQSDWTIKPNSRLSGVREVVFKFYNRDQKSAPDDVDLVLASPWEAPVKKLEALFGGTLRWGPFGPSGSLYRPVSIHRPARPGRMEGKVMFDLERRLWDENSPKVVILGVTFRRLGDPSPASAARP
jgi:hypothetical protein